MSSGERQRHTAADKLALLIEASATLLGSLEISDLLPAVLELGRKLNAAEACAIWQLDEPGHVWRLTSSLGLSDSYQLGATIPLDAALAIDNEPVCIPDTRKSFHVPERRPFLEAEGIRGILIMPLKIAGELSATLVFYYRRPHRFSAAELRVAGALANLAASAMHTAELYQNQEQTRIAAERARRRSAFLAEASSVLASSLNHETTLATVAYLAIPHIADWCIVHTVEEDGSLKQIAAHADPAKEAWARQEIARYPMQPNATTGPAAVARTGKPELRSVITDRMLRAVARDEEHLELLRSIGFTSFMCVPLKARGKVLGTMSFVSADQRNRYGPEELALAEDLAQRAAMAIDNALLYASVQRERAALETALLALQENEQRLLLAMDAGRLGIWDWNMVSNVLNWTENLIGMHGFAPGTFDGKFDTLVSVIHPEDRAAFLASVHRAVANKSEFECEFRVVFPDDSIRWIAGKGKVFCNWNGEAIRMIGLGMDVTDRRRLEEQLHKTQKLESVGLLAGGIAHDFNNLLTGIMGNAGLALTHLPHFGAAAPLVKNVLQASERAAMLTKQLLAYSGQGQFVIEPVDLSVLVQQIVCLVQANISKLVRLELELAPDLPCIEADASQLQQVVMNLMMNAAEAIDDRAGRVVVRTGRQAVDASYVRSQSLPEELASGDYVVLEVQDTGCGMPADVQAKIFDPFYTTKFTGRGLGLAAVSGIVRGHRGAIKVYSAVGQGSVFRVLFPASAQPQPAREPAQENQEMLDGEGLVLFIDAEMPVREAAEAALRHYGYQVVTAENAAEGIATLRSAAGLVAAVVLDVSMQPQSGEETLRRIRYIQPQLPVILSSGYRETEARRLFPPEMLSGFLQKPYNAISLARALKSVLPAANVQSQDR
jgi:signal transduction histidine kinase/GAF domain-containing protein/ActR/RegA family two-component response regulator